jgi:hypothetical protein
VRLYLHQINHFPNRDQRRFWPQRTGNASDLFADALYRFLVLACRGARGKQDDAHIIEALRGALQFLAPAYEHVAYR